MRVLFTLLGFWAMILACELIELPVYVEPADQNLAVSSVMIGQSGLIVNLSRSFSVLSGRNVNDFSEDFIETLLVKDGLLTLSWQNRTDTLFGGTDIPGFYAVFTSGIQNGDSLRLSVRDTVAGLSCTARTRLMPPIEPDSVSDRYETVAGFDLRTIVMSFQDPEEKNWYSLHVYSANRLSEGPDESVFLTGGESVLYSTQFSDAGAQDGRLRRAFSIGLDQDEANDTLVVVLSNIEEGYFRFLDARRRVSGVVSSFVSEPLNYPDNVEDGYGYFSAHQPRAVVFYPALDSLPAQLKPVSISVPILDPRFYNSGSGSSN